MEEKEIDTKLVNVLEDFQYIMLFQYVLAVVLNVSFSVGKKEKVYLAKLL